MSELLAGAARVCITPPVGIRMAGYASRDHGAEWVHDPLSARALYLRSGDDEAVMVATDICMWRGEAQDEARRRLTDELGIPRAAQFFNDSHTHAGPTLVGGPMEQRYAASLIDQVVGAVSWARAEARPARLSVGRAPVQLGVNRRERRPDGSIVLGVNPAGHVLPFVDVARFDGDDGRPIACLYSHACHPTTLGPSHYLISADYPGIASARLEAELGAPALFLQGCCGNINSHPRDGLEHVVPHGNRLAEAVLGVAEALEPVAEPALQAVERRFELPLEQPPSRAEATAALRRAEAELAAAHSEHERFWANRRVDQARSLLRHLRRRTVPAGYPLTMSLLRLGEWAMVALAGEVFSTLAASIADGSPARHTVILGYTNGWFGYLPDAPVWDEGGYEYNVRIHHAGLPIARESGEELVGEALAMLGQFAASST